MCAYEETEQQFWIAASLLSCVPTTELESKKRLLIINKLHIIVKPTRTRLSPYKRASTSCLFHRNFFTP